MLEMGPLKRWRLQIEKGENIDSERTNHKLFQVRNRICKVENWQSMFSIKAQQIKQN